MLGLLRRRKIDESDRLTELLGDYELPAFPAAILQALELVHDGDCSFARIADVISSDPGLSVRVLTTANAAAFSLRHEVRSIHHAVTLLGREQIESLLISFGVRQALPVQTVAGYDAARFWRTAARRACTAKALAEIVDPANASESSTAGLLQDMAIPVLAQRRPEYGQVLEAWHGGADELVHLELERYDWDHTQVGEWMATRWKLPAMLAEAIRTHHGAGEPPFPAARVVSSLREVDSDSALDTLVEGATERFDLAEEHVRQLVDTAFEQAESMARLFS